ncbi:hypothetical protein CYMTET_23314 [Cymbomonas tetramitiformis]|uniref:Uncharacterized protein n=1 Tax=Cymbomonas tetramitiformis TaxID=36881 RepID=A0AAE0FYY0_9CHLO|nr:hypothetical protein CYMTET_31880 [Cymbomonas tetramitiformis]KAK3268170.1 hypothetical protein CYMTET_23314 [Cymbomonas tetramitiformis]
MTAPVRDAALGLLLKRPEYKRVTTAAAETQLAHVTQAIQQNTVKAIESQWTAEIGLVCRIRCKIPGRKYQYRIHALGKRYCPVLDDYKHIQIFPAVNVPSIGTHASRNVIDELK